MKKTTLNQVDLNNKRVYIWGACERGGVILDCLKKLDIDVISFLDNKKYGEYCSLKIVPPLNILNCLDENTIIIIGSLRYDTVLDIQNQIEKCVFSGQVLTSYDFYMMYERKLMFSTRRISYKIDYEKLISNWFNHFLDEVRFWRYQVADDKGGWHYTYRNRFKKREFDCERIKNETLIGDEIILDVGCGISSQYGKYVKGKLINLISVDPLAHFYNEINRRFVTNLSSDEQVDDVRFGMFELLSAFFGKNYCDYILIDNALDHCIDPLVALKECLNVVKKGGIVSLRHHTNEAYRENYHGLHQWNISTNENNELFIWNNTEFINVNKELGENVEINSWHEKGHFKYSPFGLTVSNIKKLAELDENANKWRWAGMVMNCMMKKLSEVSYATEMTKIMC